MTPAFEFSRPIEVARISPRGSHEHLKADPKECQALAKRLNVETIHVLHARLVATPWRAGGVKVAGTLTADLDQISIISLEPFRSTVTFDIERYFLPPGTEASDETDAIEGGVIDLGEVVSETLALSLDPYPRKDGENFAGFDSEKLPEAPESNVSPFANLADRFKKPS
jgi:uncharacterized metal-binding protein YceD (DUF177 family)